MYIDIINNRKIDLERDVCSLEEWNYGNPNKKVAALHDKGFLVFLSPDKIEKSDEYKEYDPYHVEENLDSAFQMRRHQLTLNTIKLINDLPEEPVILDMGCGEGYITQAIKSEYPKSKVFGLDYSISAINTAHQKFKGINFLVADAYYPPYPDNFFDLVILNNIWEHVPDPLNLLSAIKRVLKPNGYIVISTPSRYRFSNLIKVLKGKPIGFMSKLHVTEYTVGQMREMLNFGDFKLIKSYSKSYHSGGLITRIIKRLFNFYLAVVSSHHNFESTVFYLARKNNSFKIK